MKTNQKNKPMIIYCDGGCLNNQKADARAAYGSYLMDEGSSKGEFEFGNKTNNQAEYLILIEALKEVHLRPVVEPVKILMDSQLVVKQISGEFACRNKDLKPLYQEVKKLIDSYSENIELSWISNIEIKKILGH